METDAGEGFDWRGERAAVAAALASAAETTSESVPRISSPGSSGAPRFAQRRPRHAPSSPAARWVPVALARLAQGFELAASDLELRATQSRVASAVFSHAFRIDGRVV